VSDGIHQLAGLIWSVSDILRGHFKVHEIGRIVLPFTLIRRLECSPPSPDEGFHNTSGLSLKTIADAPEDARSLLHSYVDAFSPEAAGVFGRFAFARTIVALDAADLLSRVVQRFAALDLGPGVSNREMSLLSEELFRRIAEASNETAGEHFTPRDVVGLIATMLVFPDGQRIRSSSNLSVFDPVCGTGGLLTETEEQIRSLRPGVEVALYGQEINAETWAMCKADLMLAGRDATGVALGNSLSADAHGGAQFDYLVGNPPMGLEWRTVAEAVREEHDSSGFNGRFGAGLPRVNDGSFLFLQHLLAKMKPATESGLGGSRIAMLSNSSPLFTGGPGSGESNIRRWLLENDWLESVVALPDQLFYNTGIGSYLWILTNRKSAALKDRVALLDGRELSERMRRPLGSKRKYIGASQLNELMTLYAEALSVGEGPEQSTSKRVRIVRNADLAYRQITVELPRRVRYVVSGESLQQLEKVHGADGLLAALRPLVGSSWDTEQTAVAALRRAVKSVGERWPAGTAFQEAVLDAIEVRDAQGEVRRRAGLPLPDPELRFALKIPVDEEPVQYFDREVLPVTPGAWIDQEKSKIGYEILPSRFYLEHELNGQFKQLQLFARDEAPRVVVREGDDLGDLPRMLRAADLHRVDLAAELPEAEPSRSPLRMCVGGDLVGQPGNWRLLPSGFGEALTSLIVLRPTRGSGRVLCEWLNSRDRQLRLPLTSARDLRDLLVPADLIEDPEVDALLEQIEDGRRALAAATAGVLPNPFVNSDADLQGLRPHIRATAHEAGLLGDLVRPLEDPVWRAESSYPHHIAALARRYRVSTHPAERKDGLLKLGEGVARILGILALSELIAAEGFTSRLRRQFDRGASFGTWLTFLRWFGEEIGAPRVPELASPSADDGAASLLADIKESRNNSHHAHGIRTSYELDDDVELLEPRVVSAVSSVSWLAGAPWEWVDRCEYLDDASYLVVGRRLRGSHPDWEPFARASSSPVRPNRIYVTGRPAEPPVDLWPLATVQLCPECRTRELFLINEIRNGVLILRSLDDHSLEIADPDVI
jgi:type I restriction enzyme M protein